MTEAEAKRAREYRARLRGGLPRVLQPCGTRAAAVRHRRNGEPVCAACLAAERNYQRDVKTRSRNSTKKGTEMTEKETT